jgi:hypothetical protein
MLSNGTKKKQVGGEKEKMNTMNSLGLGAPYYWEAKYKEEMDEIIGEVECFDWYLPFEGAWEMIESFVNMGKNHRILIVGCGRSNTVEVLYNRGYRDITAIDISPSIIGKMQKKYANYTGVEFLVMDVREMMTLSSGTFSLVIDKALTDSLMCMSDFNSAAKAAFSEIYRVMSMEGVFFSVSHCMPLARVPYLRLIHWGIDMARMTQGEKLTLFVLTKTEDEEILNRKVVGAEAPTRPPAPGLVDVFNQTMNKSSTTKKAGGGGQLTVTSSLERMMEMVAETEGVDGDRDDD